ncbi:hypothetical protein QZH41_015594, partial [Actinostola sp. cb2023]
MRLGEPRYVTSARAWISYMTVKNHGTRHCMGKYGHDTVTARSRHGHGTVTARSRHGHGTVTARSRHGHGTVTVTARARHGTARSRHGMTALFRLRKSNPNLLNSRASMKIKETIVRVGIFAFVAFAFGFITFACHLYEYSNLKMWEKSYRDYLHCIADKEVKGTSNTCVVSERPNLSVIELGLSSLFGAGIAMSSWTWTSNTFRTWKKLWH